jgi:hypothetical protein
MLKTKKCKRVICTKALMCIYPTFLDTAAPVGIGNDCSGCMPMEGLLKKINSSGVWKDRYGQLNNSYFMTYKPKAKKPTSEIKESVDLRQTESVTINKDGHLLVILDNGEEMIFKGDNMSGWIFAIQKRLQWIEDQQTINNSKGLTDANRVHISGVLKKKSHNKYQGYQVSLNSILSFFC